MSAGARTGGPAIGRPRDPDVDRAITAATLEVLGEVGYSSLTIEEVARRAGVGKSTVYRRFANKGQLVAAAIGSLTGEITPPDTGDTRRDVTEFLSRVWLRLVQGRGLTLLGTFMVEANRDPDLFDEFRRQVIETRRRPLREILERGRASGGLRTDLDIEVALDMLVGPLLAALVAGGRPDEATVRERVAAVWPALTAPQSE